MLQKEDVENIENRIFNERTTSLNEITKLFSKDKFYIDKDFDTKEECINFLADEAIKKGLMNNITKMSIFEREEMSSTSIGDLVAIPHPIYNEYGKSFISVLILNKPIMWDDLYVQVVFLLNIDKTEVKLWEPMFLKLFDYIKSKNGINSILKHKSYEKFMDEFKTII